MVGWFPGLVACNVGWFPGLVACNVGWFPGLVACNVISRDSCYVLVYVLACPRYTVAIELYM